jgi:hypothetical protein
MPHKTQEQGAPSAVIVGRLLKALNKIDAQALSAEMARLEARIAQIRQILAMRGADGNGSAPPPAAPPPKDLAAKLKIYLRDNKAASAEIIAAALGAELAAVNTVLGGLPCFSEIRANVWTLRVT